MNPIPLIVFSERPNVRASLEQSFESIDSATIVGFATDLKELERLSKETDANALLVDLLPDPQYVLDEIEKIPPQPDGLFMVGPQYESEVILRAMRLGAREFFSDPPDAKTLDAAFRKAATSLSARTPTAPTAAGSPKVVGVIGAKGGVGATTTACQLGFALQAMGKRTAIVDLNLPLGDVALHCDVSPRHTLANMASERTNTDATFVRKLLQEHDSGLRIMTSPVRIEEAESISVSHIGTALRLMREDFDWIVIDISRAWNEVSIHALDLSDIVVAVTVIDLPSLGHLKQHIELMDRLGHTRSNVKLVATRVAKHHGGLDGKDVSDFIGRDLDFKIANDFQTVAASIDAGCSVAKIAPRSDIKRQFDRLARELHAWSGVEADLPKKTNSRKGFRKLFGRK